MDCFDRDQFVYFALGPKSGLVKVGVSIDPEQRCRLSGWRLLAVIPGCSAREHAVHYELRAHAADQNEWFVPCEAVWAAIGEAYAKGDLSWLPASPPRNADAAVLLTKEIEQHFGTRAAACQALGINLAAFTNVMGGGRPSPTLWSRWNEYKRKAA